MGSIACCACASVTPGFRRPTTLSHPSTRSARSCSVNASGTQILARRVWEMRVIGNSEPDRKTAIRAPADLLCLVNGWYDNQPIVSRQETVQGG